LDGCGHARHRERVHCREPLKALIVAGEQWRKQEVRDCHQGQEFLSGRAVAAMIVCGERC
jgi:hypothetical protein